MDQNQPDNPETRIGMHWLAIFVCAFLLYALTSSQGIQWQDYGEHIVRIMTGELHNPRGLALSHPLHYYLGQLALSLGFLEPAKAITLVSSLAAAIAVANCFGCVATLTNSRKAALYAAISLAMANTVWQLATLCETYTIGIAILSGEIWCLVLFARKGKPSFALLAAFLNGLGVANHMQAALTTPVVLIVAILWMRGGRLRMPHLMGGAGLWLLGSLPYSAMVFNDWRQSENLLKTFSSALFGNDFASAVMNVAPTKLNALVTICFPLYNFPGLLLPLACSGVILLWRNREQTLIHRAIICALLIHVIFAVRYNVVDQHTFFLPAYLLLAILGGVGFSALPMVGRGKTIRMAAICFLVITPLVYAITPGIARNMGVLDSVARNKPYRDDYTYILTPWSVSETSAETLAKHVFELAGDHAVVLVEDGMALPALQYYSMMQNPTEENAGQPGTAPIRIINTQTATPDELTACRDAPCILVPADRDDPATKIPSITWLRNGDVYTSNVD